METEILKIVSEEEKGKKMELQESILEGTLQVFNQKGLKFTMDDIASALGISKKTIYTVFENKVALISAMVDYCFDSIKESERAVMENDTLDTVEKIRAILGVLPEGYREINFEQLYLLRAKYPKIYQKVEGRLESGWENTIALLQQGMEEGVIRRITIPILKTMMEATLEQFFRRDILVANQISYQKALEEVVTILMDGITVGRRDE
jgi:AcrR family transcriptional regulator